MYIYLTEFIFSYLIGSYKSLGTFNVNEQDQQIDITLLKYRKKIAFEDIEEVRLRIGIEQGFQRYFEGQISYLIFIKTCFDDTPILLHVTNNYFINNKLIKSRIWNKNLELTTILMINKMKYLKTKKIKESQIREMKIHR